jgi:imidazolonepropionase-like amidohydrolase
VTPAFLEHLATSQSAEFRFPGERDAVEGKLNKKARERLRRFLDAVVTPGER